MVTENTGLSAFDQRTYRALAPTALKYYRESLNRSNLIPTATTATLDQKEYVKPIFSKTKNIKGYDDYSADPLRATTAKNNRVYELKSVQMGLFYGPDEIMLEAQYLEQSKGEKMEEFARQVDLSIWKGIYFDGYDENGDGQGIQLVNGIIDQAGSVVDLNGTDSVLDAQGDVYKALTKMIQSIPLKYRDGRELVLGMTDNFYFNANDALFTFDSGKSEWDTFNERFMQGKNKSANITDIIVSDEVFKASTDTGGETDDRLFIFVKNEDVIEKAFSRKISLMGSRPSLVGGIEQGWGARLRGCVHDDEAVLYSEKITWA